MSALKYAEIARDSDPYNAAAFVCLGNCAFQREDYTKARDMFLCALDNDAACVEALYNLGISQRLLDKMMILHSYVPVPYDHLVFWF